MNWLAAALGAGVAADVASAAQANRANIRNVRKQKQYEMQAAEMVEQDPLVALMKKKYTSLLDDEDFWKSLLSAQQAQTVGKQASLRDRLRAQLSKGGIAGSPAGAYAAAQLETQGMRDWNEMLVNLEMQKRQAMANIINMMPGLEAYLFPGVAMRKRMAALRSGVSYEGSQVTPTLLNAFKALYGSKGLYGGSEGMIGGESVEDLQARYPAQRYSFEED